MLPLSSSAAKRKFSASTPLLVASSTRLRSNRSAITPAQTPNSSIGTVLVATTPPTWAALSLVSSRTSQGAAICSIQSAPAWLAWPSQSSR